MGSAGDLGLDQIVGLLAAAAEVPLGPGSLSQLDHALQTASILARESPDQPELIAAGLVHDIGHLLPGVGDEEHAVAGAAAVRTALGEQVAAIVALHVEAKRYLVTTEPGYRSVLSADSTASLGHQGGTLQAPALQAFLSQPQAEAAVTLRRADDRAKCAGVVIAPLDHWVPLLHQLSHGSGRTET